PHHHNRYDITHYKNIYRNFPTNQHVFHLIHQPHKPPIKILIHLLLNHTSHHHASFPQTSNSKHNPYPHYYFSKHPKPHPSHP
ncbi:alpha-amylase family glycosyl hydrolase, partial [Bacillus subtilis]|uniref:alpha-amylase family glycosyl hydrolase n=1 Tax=Bacillus subtilis TaxID=1423 RepID=UPI00338F824E